ncbi:MAG: D-glycero-beta-D-manno-heptose 1,7-bisphosphate 7-phosphatase [Deltaproteobacteria bacterium]|jgi:D-glycero-D-manno-heptose 1,7-bisphosphate phosphatase|nr:D-glycero-beta-D-manno-heptose 1,7-bisphosphate 7-phosphatase [Deltaproteobacteria bacterium]
MSALGRPAVLMDRDGTINHDVGYLWRWEDFRWIAGAPEALAALSRAGFALAVITNQSGVARGFYRDEDVLALHRSIQADLKARAGVDLDGWYHCPHLPDACSCRKPKPGLIERAASELGLDLSASYMIGDKAADAQAGLNAGVHRTILVRTGCGRQEEAERPPQTAAVDDLTAAAALILAEAGDVR